MDRTPGDHRFGGRVAMAGALVLGASLAVAGTARADPTKQECVAANDRAQDLRLAGKLRAAREALAVCVAMSCPGPVREDCAARLAEIAAAQPRVVLSAQDGAGNDLGAVRVTLDGAPFADSLDGSARDVDPGEHVFVFEGAGGARVEKRVVLREGEKRREVRVQIGAAPAPAPTSTTPTAPGATGSAPADGAPAGGGERGGASPWAYAAFAVGGVGLVVGTAFGAIALGTKSTLDGACGPARTGCPAGEVNDLNTQAWGADIGFGVGIAGALAGAIVLWSSRGAADDANRAGVTPWVGVGSAGVSGRFR